MDSTTAVRTRFPPSPTGDLHLGGARVALFNYLFARHHGGQFILRMEDTDRERSSSSSVESILRGMEWLGLEYDEGPFYQTQRLERYQAVIDQLLAEGKAYRCACTKERLDNLRATQQANKEKMAYDGYCRDLSVPADVPHVVRFKTPQSGQVIFQDQVLGEVIFENGELDDLIIARSDGFPTYHLTVVVDDLDMGISHVIRGVDHVSNTPRQIHLLQALGARLPVYAHLPMVLGSDGKRLSKRHGAVDVTHYQRAGYLPQALLNQLVRLGWSFGDQEIFTVEEMIKEFTLDAVTRSDAVLDMDKLNWLNQHYMKALSVDEVLPALTQQFITLGIDCTQGPVLEDVYKLQMDRYKTLQDLAEDSQYFYKSVQGYSPKGEKHLVEDALQPLLLVLQQLEALSVWSADTIKGVLNQVVETTGLKFGKVAQPIRVAVTGDTRSPSMDVTLLLLGQEVVAQRLKAAIDYISA
ncbi:MAG: glutamate--tRNA ligase [Coxiellaceae bacterium]|nr:glutamate--tRNA ligase [Coxiellaceae bacterium]